MERETGEPAVEQRATVAALQAKADRYRDRPASCGDGGEGTPRGAPAHSAALCRKNPNQARTHPRCPDARKTTKVLEGLLRCSQVGLRCRKQEAVRSCRTT